MWFLIFFITLFSIRIINIDGAYYRVQHESINVVSYNKEYIHSTTAKVFQYNKTSKAYNMTINMRKPITQDTKVAIQGYLFQLNEYRKVPYKYTTVICDMFRRNDFGVRAVYAYSNFRGCPATVNLTYYVANFMLDDSKIPQGLLVPGRYKGDATVFNRKTKFGFFELYMSIVADTP